MSATDGHPASCERCVPIDLERAALWRLLAGLFRREVDESHAERIRRARLPEGMADSGYPLPDPELRALPGLRAEFMRVFVGPGPHASPYGSVHHPDDLRRGHLWGTTTVLFHALASAHGLEIEGGTRDSVPDHVAHELELYARLLAVRGRARLTGDEDRVQRLDHSVSHLYHLHLERWIPPFLARVASVAGPGSFYAQVAGLTRALLAAEGALVAPIVAANAP